MRRALSHAEVDTPIIAALSSRIIPDCEVDGWSNRREYGDARRAAEKIQQMVLERNFGSVALAQLQLRNSGLFLIKGRRCAQDAFWDT